MQVLKAFQCLVIAVFLTLFMCCYAAQAFSKVLLAVMLLSTCLLYASSFGLTGY